MIRAILEKGVIRPADPLPTEWQDGTELGVQECKRPESADRIHRWYAELEALGGLDDDDWAMLESALLDADGQARETLASTGSRARLRARARRMPTDP